MGFEDRNEEEEEDDNEYELSLRNSATIHNQTRPLSPPPIPLSLSFPAIRKKPTTTTSRYTECLKNHAARIGGHALDGCREFMPAGPEGSMEALICAACNCHRNFHRKKAVDPTPDQQIQFPQISCYNYQQQRAHSAALFRFYPYGKTRPPGGKRFRTKFTEEQKERMKGLAERVGWRLHKEDESPVRRFCQETGLSRRVLKVWMHNHKQTLGKKLAPP